MPKLSLEETAGAKMAQPRLKGFGVDRASIRLFINTGPIFSRIDCFRHTVRQLAGIFLLFRFKILKHFMYSFGRERKKMMMMMMMSRRRRKKKQVMIWLKKRSQRMKTQIKRAWIR